MRLILALVLSILIGNSFHAAPAAEPSAPSAPAFHSLPDQPQPIRIAIYSGPGSTRSGIRHVERRVKLLPGATIERLPAAAIRERDLGEFDLVIFSGGAASAQAKDIGDAGRQKVRRFVRDGGAYLGVCAGAYLACAEFDWGLQLIAAGTVSDRWQRGKGMVQMQLTDDGRSAFGPIDAPLAVAYENGPVIAPHQAGDHLAADGADHDTSPEEEAAEAAADELAALPPYRTLAAFTTELAENGTPPGIMTGSPAIAEAPYGKGRVMIISPHPERTPGLEQLLPLAITRLTAADSRQSPGDRGQGTGDRGQ
jgi:hypothetical protein